MSVGDFIGYAIAQILGALAGAAILYLILSGKASGWTGGLGQNGWGTGYLGEYNMFSALVFEVVATFLFLVCILGVIHIVGINVTGVSVNPARSIGPVIMGMAENVKAVSQLWLFIVAPLIGADIAGMMFKSGLLAAKND